MQGYYQARVFYSPRYDINSESLKPDLRSTIYWNPDLKTNAEGAASCSFFNSDQKAIIFVDVQGITEDRIPVSGIIKYPVN